jgi:hypothetical protein
MRRPRRVRLGRAIVLGPNGELRLRVIERTETSVTVDLPRKKGGPRELIFHVDGGDPPAGFVLVVDRGRARGCGRVEAPVRRSRAGDAGAQPPASARSARARSSSRSGSRSRRSGWLSAEPGPYVWSGGCAATSPHDIAVGADG